MARARAQATKLYVAAERRVIQLGRDAVQYNLPRERVRAQLDAILSGLAQAVAGIRPDTGLPDRLTKTHRRARSQVMRAARSKTVATYDRLMKAGVKGYIDTAGRQWSWSSYAAAAERSAADFQRVQGQIDALMARGVTTVRVVRQRATGVMCWVCAKFEGAVMNWDALNAAIDMGLFHPNCGHGVEDAETQIGPGGRTVIVNYKSPEMGKWFSRLNVPADRAVSSYIGSGYEDINLLLRKGKVYAATLQDTSYVKSLQKQVAILDAIITAAPRMKERVVWRGMSPKSFLSTAEMTRDEERAAVDAFNFKSTVGKSWLDDAFASSSVNRRVAEGFASGKRNGVVAEFHLSRDVRGAALSEINGGEGEFVMERGLTYRVISYTPAKDRYGQARIVVQVSKEFEAGAMPKTAQPKSVVMTAVELKAAARGVHKGSGIDWSKQPGLSKSKSKNMTYAEAQAAIAKATKTTKPKKGYQPAGTTHPHSQPKGTFYGIKLEEAGWNNLSHEDRVYLSARAKKGDQDAFAEFETRARLRGKTKEQLDAMWLSLILGSGKHDSWAAWPYLTPTHQNKLEDLAYEGGKLQMNHSSPAKVKQMRAAFTKILRGYSWTSKMIANLWLNGPP